MKDDLTREKAMERLVGARVRAGLKPGGESCLGAETLAAYVERTLAPGERATCESHLASCARCQEHVAALIRLSEADEPVRAKSAAAATATARARISWFRWVYVGPVFAALLVAGIYVIGPFRGMVQQPPEVRTPSLPQVTKQTPPSATPEQDKPTLPAQKRERAVTDANPHDEESLHTASPPVKASAPPRRSVAGVAGGPPPKGAQGASIAPALPTPPLPKPARAEDQATATNLQRNEPTANERGQAIRSREIATPTARAEITETRRGDGRGAGGGTAGAAVGGIVSVPPRQPSTEKSKDQTTETPPSAKELPSAGRNQMDISNLKKPEAKKAKSDYANAKKTSDDQRDQNLKPRAVAQSVTVTSSTESVEVTAANPAPMWRVGRHGRIEQRTSNGNWVKRQSGVRANLRDISFPTSEVGWAVGDDGTILRSTDGGNSWNEIHSPTSDRIVHITANSDQQATIVTRGGVTFATVDGGITWTTPSSE